MDTSETVSNKTMSTQSGSFRDTAHIYLNSFHDKVFHDLVANCSQLPSKISMMKTSKLKQRSLEKLKATEEQLSEVTALREMWKAQCEDQRRLVVNLENEVISKENEGRELDKQLAERSKQFSNMELVWCQSIRIVADDIAGKLNSRISSDLGEITPNLVAISDYEPSLRNDAGMQ